MEGSVGAASVDGRLVRVLHEVLDVSHLVVNRQQLIRVHLRTHLYSDNTTENSISRFSE